MNKLNFAIIGCGRIAKRHAKHINTYGKLVAVCDIIIEKARGLAENYDNVNVYSDIDNMLKNQNNIDIVSICSPNGLHAEHSIKSLESGFHVLCEKPMALRSYDCGKMIKASEKSNKRLFAIKQNRFNPPVEAVKKLIDQNSLGKIYSIQLSCFWNRNDDYYKDSWKGSKEMDGGTLFTQFSHFIDLIIWMFGDIKEVNGFMNNFNHQKSVQFEDSGVVSLKFYSGALGTINFSINSYNKNMEGSLTIISEKGTVKIGGQYLNELEYQEIKDVKIENLPVGNTANNYGNYVGSMSNHGEVYKNLIDVINDNAPISTSSFEGLKTVEAIEKIYESIRNE
tara:strand:+ start:160 stop:1173 length:1014 start_codon:yes stop_codon:yes gene_type:complete